MNFFKLLKWAWEDAKCEEHCCLNEYSYERGRRESNILTPKSEYFEKQVFQSLSKVYGCGLKKILVDLYIPKSDGNTSQLDIVFINKSGIYVVEVKNYSCYVEGNNTDEWIKKDFKGKSYKLYNPVKQNMAHIRHLNSLLMNYPSWYYKSVIVFPNATVIKYEDNKGTRYTNVVTKLSDIRNEIINITMESEVVFSDENIYNIYNELSMYARVDYNVKRRHLEYVRSLQS